MLRAFLKVGVIQIIGFCLHFIARLKAVLLNVCEKLYAWKNIYIGNKRKLQRKRKGETFSFIKIYIINNCDTRQRAGNVSFA